MASYPLSTIAQWLNLPAPEEDCNISHLLTDSRQLQLPAATLFVALTTASNDGHRYLPAMAAAGVKAFLVQQDQQVALPKSVCVLRVPDTLKALQTLAARHRQQCSRTTFVGITGSNGKTVVKEWLNQLLQGQYRVGRSPRSFNSQLGVALSLWGIDPADELALLEAGISQPGEMEALAAMVQPQIGILTSLGDAHDAGFASQQQKLEQKALLFAQCDTLIVHRQSLAQLGLSADSFFAGRTKPGLNLIIIGQQPGDALCYEVVEQAGSSELSIVYRQQPAFRVALTHNHAAHVQNLLTCAALLLHLGVSTAFLQAQLPLLRPLHMRLQLVQGRHGIRLLNDSYSNDLRSLETALQQLHAQAGDQPKALILSDMAEQLLPPEQLYRQVAELLQHWPVQQLVLVGPELQRQQGLFAAFTNSLRSYTHTAALLESLDPSTLARHFILLKGARHFQFEIVAQEWQAKSHQTVVEVHLNALEHNLRFYRSLLEPTTKIMAMVKAFGYGSGGAELATLLAHQQVDYLAVAYADEAVELRQAGITLPMMVMNVDATVFPQLVAHQLEPEIFSLALLDQWLAYASGQGLSQHPIHLKLDTGMHRLGLSAADLPALLERLRHNNYVRVQTVFSHFAASEDAAETAFTKQQFALFQQMADALEQALERPFLRHISNSGGIGLHPQFQLDMIRLGIGLYGVDSSGLHQQQLLPVMRFVTTVSQVHQLKAGDTVGYNRRGVLHRDSVVATLRAGYADGYPRSLGHGVGKVIIHGQSAPVLGTVCMDMLMVDVTDLHHPVQPGDEAELFGPQMPVQELAKAAGTIAYEILTGIGQRVQRVYVRD